MNETSMFSRNNARRLLLLALPLVCLLSGGISWAAAPAPAAAASTATAAPAKNVVLLDSASGRAFVPSRALDGLNGIHVQWDAARQQLTIAQGEATSAILKAGSAKAEVNGEPVALADAPFALAGATYVPLQFVSATFNLPAEWDKAAGSITLGQGDARLTLPYASRSALTAPSGPIVNPIPEPSVSVRARSSVSSGELAPDSVMSTTVLGESPDTAAVTVAASGKVSSGVEKSCSGSSPTRWNTSERVVSTTRCSTPSCGVIRTAARGSAPGSSTVVVTADTGTVTSVEVAAVTAGAPSEEAPQPVTRAVRDRTAARAHGPGRAILDSAGTTPRVATTGGGTVEVVPGRG